MAVLSKIFGTLLFVFGLLMAILFPMSRYYQPDRMSFSGILIGLGLMGAGVYLIVYG